MAAGLENRIPGLANACSACDNRAGYRCQIQELLVQSREAADKFDLQTTFGPQNEIARLPAPPEGCPIK